MSPGDGMLSVEVIRAEFKQALAELQLQLVQHFATKKEHNELESRVTNLETLSNRMKGALALLTATVLAFGTFVVQHFWH